MGLSSQLSDVLSYRKNYSIMLLILKSLNCELMVSGRVCLLDISGTLKCLRAWNRRLFLDDSAFASGFSKFMELT